MKHSAFIIKEVHPRVFLFEFSDEYDLSMHFLRYQEFYESPSLKFRGKAFALLDYMDWYAHKFGHGAFTYTRDFGGYNIPGETIAEVQETGVPDFNRYDLAMDKAYHEVGDRLVKQGDRTYRPFYIIGTLKDHGVLNHELSHAFFYLYPEYRKEMTGLVRALPKRSRRKINKWLKGHCYCPKVYIDETVAYLATGGPWDGIDSRQFKKVFKRRINER
jgi:hypothetical protein